MVPGLARAAGGIIDPRSDRRGGVVTAD